MANIDFNSDMAQFLNQLHSDYDNGVSHPLPEPQKPEPQEEATFTGNVEYKIGDEIPDEDGNVYVAIQNSYYISQSNAADTEEGYDISLPTGWHTPARLKSPVTQVIIEQVQAGEAEIVRREGVRQVLFHGEGQYIPLSDLAYNPEIGLYQKSKFPDVEGK